jgi:hypothetical protein
MHHQAMIRISGKHIWNYLAKGSGEKPLIHMPDRLMHILLAGGNSSLKVSGRVTHLDQFCGI